tara:strand:+ start:1023 stop:1199 length:177 start_codon:yes stop_codon:yes gene_type:complete
MKTLGLVKIEMGDTTEETEMGDTIEKIENIEAGGTTENIEAPGMIGMEVKSKGTVAGL